MNRIVPGFSTEGARVNTSRALPRFLTQVAILVAAFLFSGCLSGEEGGAGGLAPGQANQPPVVKAVSILPSPVVLSEPVKVLVEAQDLDQQTISFRYRWFVNEKAVDGQTKNELPAELLKRGDRVAVEVTPFDGLAQGAPAKTQPTVVENTPPIVSHIAIDPDDQSIVRRLIAKADILDPDGDPVTVVYRWRKNDEVVKEGEANDLDVTSFTAKDIIQVDVVASDGIATGKPVPSQAFEMNNTAPRFTSSPPSAVQGTQYEYQAVAQDPDDDPVTYLLEVAPPGMTIHPKSGLIHWAVSPELKGIHRVRIIAKDSRGAFSTQEFDLSLAAPPTSS